MAPGNSELHYWFTPFNNSLMRILPVLCVIRQRGWKSTHVFICHPLAFWYIESKLKMIIHARGSTRMSSFIVPREREVACMLQWFSHWACHQSFSYFSCTRPWKSYVMYLVCAQRGHTCFTIKSSSAAADDQSNTLLWKLLFYLGSRASSQFVTSQAPLTAFHSSPILWWCAKRCCRRSCLWCDIGNHSHFLCCWMRNMHKLSSQCVSKPCKTLKGIFIIIDDVYKISNNK